MPCKQRIETTLNSELASFQIWAMQPYGGDRMKLRNLVLDIQNLTLRVEVLKEMIMQLEIVNPEHIRSMISAMFLYDELERTKKMQDRQMMNLVEHFVSFSRPYWKRCSKTQKKTFARTYFDYLQWYFAENDDDNAAFDTTASNHHPSCPPL